MSHYINLLEDNECVFVSAAASKPIYKILGAAIGAAVIFFAVNSYLTNTRLIAEAADLTIRWKDLEPKSKEAQARADEVSLLQRDTDTLLGWSPSRFPWPKILEHLAASIPEPKANMQFVRLSFDENIEGLRRHNPDSGVKVARLRREVTLTLMGRVLSDRPEALLADFQRNLTQEVEGLPRVARAQLQGNMRKTPHPSGGEITEFTYTLELEPREVKP